MCLPPIGVGAPSQAELLCHKVIEQCEEQASSSSSGASSTSSGDGSSSSTMVANLLQLASISVAQGLYDEAEGRAGK